MAALFADLPEALASTVEIAERCAFRPHAQADPAALHDYRERLDFELDVIERMKYPGYFLIVADFIKWAKANGHSGRAGPRLGRGLAGRLCADHHRPRSDPLRPAVRALPQSRARVDAGLRHRLLPGPARRGDPLRAAALRPRPVAQIITFGTLQARGVLRDVGRVLQMPYGQVDKLQAGAATIRPTGDAGARDRTASRSCRRRDETIRWCARAFDIAMKLEGLPATPRPTPPAS
jgi:DNA polymerase-3 subunit alpha